MAKGRLSAGNMEAVCMSQRKKMCIGHPRYRSEPRLRRKGRIYRGFQDSTFNTG
jgi:hypothetical protein